MFCTECGRQDLCKQTKSSRIIVIILGHGHTFDKFEEIKSELSPKIIELAPMYCSNLSEIPFMTAGSDIGEKSLIDVAKNDKISNIIVQDIKNSDTTCGSLYR